MTIRAWTISKCIQKATIKMHEGGWRVKRPVKIHWLGYISIVLEQI